LRLRVDWPSAGGCEQAKASVAAGVDRDSAKVMSFREDAVGIESGATDECLVGSEPMTSASEARNCEAGTAAIAAAETAVRKSLFERWAPVLLKFVSLQVVVQGIGFCAGILIVRNLPKSEYALFTLGNTVLATFLLLSDSGISSAIMAIGGRIWRDRQRLSQLMRTALDLRRSIAMIALPVVILALSWLLRKNGATNSKIAILVMLVLAGCGFELVTRMYAVPLRLFSEIRQIQSQALAGAIVKLALVVACILLWFNAEFAIVAVVAGYAVQYWLMRRWYRKNLEPNAPGDAAMRKEILTVVRRQAPNSIY
jgi:hypothetical protein